MNRKTLVTSPLVGFACFVIIIGGVIAIKDLIIPLLLAIFIAILLKPAIDSLERRNIPYALAILLVMVGFLLLWIVLMTVVGNSVQSFISEIGQYKARFKIIEQEFLSAIEILGIQELEQTWEQYIAPEQVFTYIAKGFNSLGAVLTDTFLIVLLVGFILYDRISFRERLQHSFPSASDNIDGLLGVSAKIQNYIAIKTYTSILTGTVITLGLFLIGVDYPLLWGFLAFGLNFIPNIGSIIAAIAPVLLAVIQLGLGYAIFTALLFIVTNLAIGSILEPKIMGKKQGISALVVLLSLLFWGWVLGVVGMFLAVPLTVVTKLFLESNPKTVAIGRLLSDNIED